MATLTKSIVINAPAEKIFAFMDDPQNLVGIWPGPVEVSDVGQLPNGGVCYRYVFKVAGIRAEGYSEDIEHVQNVRTVSKSSEGIDYLATVTFEPVGAGTKVTISNDYQIPVPVLGRLAEAVVIKTTEKDTETLLANLKGRMEG